MEALFIYFGKMILCSAVMFGYYHLMLKNKTFHHYNRFYLLLIVAVSLLLPLLKISYFTIEVDNDLYALLNTLQNFNTTKNITNDFLYFEFAAVAFGLVSIILLGKLFFGIIKIYNIQKQFPKEKIENIAFYNTNLENAPFSYFRNLFWKDSILLQSDLGRQILKHEMVHIEQKHSLDKIIMEAVTGILWFNPVFWFIKREINLIHEYLADKKAVKNADTKAFAQMLLASHFSGKVLPATSPFLSSNLKKRLKMLQKPKTKFGYAHRILALPIVFMIAFAYLVNAKNNEIAETNKELKQDTVKKTVTATLVKVKPGDPLPSWKEAKDAPENALFIVNSKEVSKTEYLDFVKNNSTRNIVTGYISPTKDEKSSVFGERQKYGVYEAELMSEQGSNTDEYHKLIEKYNPDWYKNIILKNKIEAEQEQKKKSLEIYKSDIATAIRESAKADKDAANARLVVTEAKKDAEKAARDAVKAQKDAQSALLDAKNAKKEAEKKADEARKIAIERAKIAAERAELARKQAELMRQEFELNKKDPNLQNAPWIVGVGTYQPKVLQTNTYSATSSFKPNSEETVGSVLKTIENSEKEGKTNLLTQDLVVYIDGKKSTYAEAKKLDTRKIKSINVIKANGENTMRIELK